MKNNGHQTLYCLKELIFCGFNLQQTQFNLHVFIFTKNTMNAILNEHKLQFVAA